MRDIQDCRIALMESFPNSFFNDRDEFIAHLKSNQYIILSNCKDELDVKCKLLEWFSRPAHKTAPYSKDWRNDRFHTLMLDGVNKFLSTNLSKEQISVVYGVLGNAINHEKTIEFIKSDYNMAILS